MPENDPLNERRFEYREPPRQPIFNTLPPVILWLVAIMVVVHGLTTISETFQIQAFFWGAVITEPLLSQLPPRPLSGLPSLLLHVFLHGSWMHLGLNVFILMATANAAARPFGSGPRGIFGFLAFFFVCSAVGAAFHIFLQGGEGPMIGASTGVSGMMAAAGWAVGGRQGALQFVLPWLVINLAMAIFDTAFGLPISWAGHIGGLLAGAILYPTFVRQFFSRRR